MRSDESTVFPAALEKAREAFRSALVSAEEQIRGYVAMHRARTDDSAQVTSLELGKFAGGRVDSGRFAALVTGAPSLTSGDETVIVRCADVMARLLARGEAVHTCSVPPGADPGTVVDAAFADAGRAFGAALVFRAVRAGNYSASQHDVLLDAYPFSRWTRAERAIAPPLVVHVNGADLRAGHLAQYIDGHVKLLLVVSGDCTPAPLARLVTPGAFIQQADDMGALSAFAAFDGPAVAAVVPATAALFVNNPAAARRDESPLTVSRVPDAPSRANGTWSVWQQSEELALLGLLARTAHDGETGEQQTVATDTAGSNAGSTAAPMSPPGSSAPAADDERTLASLTGWILSQSGMGGITGAP